MNIPYIERYEGNWCVRYVPLNPTGRWKIESNAYYEDKLFIEHKGWVLCEWVPEDDIYFKPAPRSMIAECTT